MVTGKAFDNRFSRSIGKLTAFFNQRRSPAIYLLCITLILVPAVIPIQKCFAITCTCCCQKSGEPVEGPWEVSSDYPGDTCETLCHSWCSGGFDSIDRGESVPCGDLESRSEVATVKVNRSYGYGYEPTGEPIVTNSGAYYFDMPLLNLGGPTGLGFTLHYRSDEDNVISRNPNDFPARNQATRFWWNPRCRAKIEEGYVTFRLEDGTMVAFEEQGSQWQLYEEAREEQPDNGQPVRYTVQETDNFIYLMSPIKGKVYIFQKSGSENAKGRILYIIDRNNNKLTYTYAGAEHNNPTKIDDGLGRELNFTYSTPAGGEEGLTKVTDHAGREITFEYEYAEDNDNNWSLRSVTDVMGQTTSFEYQAVTNNETTYVDNIEKVTHPEGNAPYTQVYGYHEVSEIGAVRADSQTDAYGNTINLDWGTDSYKMTENRPDGSTVVHEYFSHHSRPKSWSDGAGNTVDFTKNDHEQITSITDRLGDTTSFTYHNDTGKISSVTNAKGETVSHTYTSQNQTFTNPDNAETVDFTFYNLTRTSYPDGTNEQYTYDARGNWLTRIDRAGKTWAYTYNSGGQVLTATNPTSGVKAYTYNADATLASSEDSDTGLTTYGYDNYKRLNMITHPDSSAFWVVYDLNDRITSVTDENDHTYAYTYNANGNLTKVTDPSGNDTDYAYDLMDRVIQVTDRLGKNADMAYDSMSRLNSVTDPNGIQTSFGYDSRGWLTGTTIGGRTWQTEYDDERVVSSRTTPLENTTTFQSDKLGNTTGITNPLSQTTTFTRDSMGRITAMTDPLSQATSYTYDNRGPISSVTMPVIGTAGYTRNDLGLLSVITDLNGGNWTFGYTNMGRLQSTSDPLGNTWQHTYDNRGRPTQTTYPDAATLTRTYDDASNLKRSLYSGGLDLQYTYDGLDRLLTANGLGLSRDAEGRVVETDNSGTVFDATYDDGGRLATATYNNGAFTVTYTYEPATGLLNRVTDNLTNTQIDFSYDNDWKLTGITRSNGLNATLTYDNAGRLTRIQDGDIDILYTLDAAGQVIMADMTVPLDPANVLTSATDSYTYGAASQISSAGYNYDGQGRRVSDPGHTYTWDDASRLTGIDRITMTYNDLRDLTSRTEGSSVTYYYYNYAIDGRPIVAEKDEASGLFLHYYVWTPGGRLLYMIDAESDNAVHFYHFDRAGSTLALTDGSGAVTDSYAYTPYGKLLGRNGTNEQPFTFVGTWGVRNEGDSGNIYHMGARYYDAATGGFISREPVWPLIQNPKMLNPYQYALSAPSLYIDPTGLKPISEMSLAELRDESEKTTTHLLHLYDISSEEINYQDISIFILSWGLMLGDEYCWAQYIASQEVFARKKRERKELSDDIANTMGKLDQLSDELSKRRSSNRESVNKTGSGLSPSTSEEGGSIPSNKMFEFTDDKFTEVVDIATGKPVSGNEFDSMVPPPHIEEEPFVFFFLRFWFRGIGLLPEEELRLHGLK